MMTRPGSLVEQLECPRCARRVDTFEPEGHSRGFHVCYRRRCGQTWWTMRLYAGEVEPQLAAVFTEQLARDLMTEWRLPAQLERPAYWQLSLSRAQADRARETGSSAYLKRLLALLRLGRASLALESDTPVL